MYQRSNVHRNKSHSCSSQCGVGVSDHMVCNWKQHLLYHIFAVKAKILIMCYNWGSFYKHGITLIQAWIYKHGITLIQAWISNHILNKVWDEITPPFPNFNGATVEVWEWINNSIPHFAMGVITYPCWQIRHHRHINCDFINLQV